jgi:hypothetical protein
MVGTGTMRRATVAVVAAVIVGGLTATATSAAGWSQQQELTAGDGASGDLFGDPVSLSADGSTALIGADGRSSHTGAAYVFTRSGSTWSQQQELTASDAAPNDYFGYSVSLSADGSTALVGAFNKNSGTGAAYVFTRSGSTWSQQQELTASDAATNDAFAISVSLSSSGNTALIGAHTKNSGNGAAYVFIRTGTSWSQQQELTASDGAHNDFFGSSTSLNNDGSTALIGAFDKNSGTGAAYVFTQSGTAWSQQQELTASDAATGDYFSYSVSLSGDGSSAMVTAGNKNAYTGAAYVFTRSGTTWSQQQELTAGDGASGDLFGNSASLSRDGSTALIGAYGKSSLTGATYVFTRSGSTWSQQQELTASDAATNDAFGYSVSLSGGGSTGLIGAPNKNAGTGAAYVFTGPPSTTATSVTSSKNPSVRLKAVTFTATVSPAPDGGTVSFANNGKTIAGCSSVAVTGGNATCSVTFHRRGNHLITATYSGDANYAASTGSLTQKVIKRPGESDEEADRDPNPDSATASSGGA